MWRQVRALETKSGNRLEQARDASLRRRHARGRRLHPIRDHAPGTVALANRRRVQCAATDLAGEMAHLGRRQGDHVHLAGPVGPDHVVFDLHGTAGDRLGEAGVGGVGQRIGKQAIVFRSVVDDQQPLRRARHPADVRGLVRVERHPALRLDPFRARATRHGVGECVELLVDRAVFGGLPFEGGDRLGERALLGMQRRQRRVQVLRTQLGPVEAENPGPVGELLPDLVPAQLVLEYPDHFRVLVELQVPPAAGARGVVGNPLLGVEALEILALLARDLLGEALQRVRVGFAVLPEVAEVRVFLVIQQRRVAQRLDGADMAQRPVVRPVQRSLHRLGAEVGQLLADLATRLVQCLSRLLPSHAGIPQLLAFSSQLSANRGVGLMRARALDRGHHVTLGTGTFPGGRCGDLGSLLLARRIEAPLQAESLHLGVELLQLFFVDIAPVLVLVPGLIQHRREVVRLLSRGAHHEVEELLAIGTVELQHLQREERRIPRHIHRRQLQPGLDAAADLPVQLGILTRTEWMLRNLLVPTVAQPIPQLAQPRSGGLRLRLFRYPRRVQ
ncbi:hypothetical protein GCM10023319_24190 [Nocardia iowensis]